MPDTSVLTREEICKRADTAARAFVAAGAFDGHHENPYPVASDAAAVYEACFERYLQMHLGPDGEGSA
jgi:hypothetical protein